MISVTELVRGMKDVRTAALPAMLIGIVALGAYVFLELADDIGEEEIGAIDRALLLAFRNPADFSDPLGPVWLQEFVTEITSLGGYPILVALVATVAGYLIVARKYGPALFVVLSTGLGTVVSQLLKLAYERPRPDLVDHLDVIHTASFPSGHATMSAIVYLTLAALIVRLVEETRVRVYVMSVAVLLSVAVGLSRIYLGVHWPSDVAAGWALGAAWASLSWLVVSALRAWRRREKLPDDQPA
jgi:undecaprenyl-diphosphatase